MPTSIKAEEIIQKYTAGADGCPFTINSGTQNAPSTEKINIDHYWNHYGVTAPKVEVSFLDQINGNFVWREVNETLNGDKLIYDEQGNVVGRSSRGATKFQNNYFVSASLEDNGYRSLKLILFDRTYYTLQQMIFRAIKCAGGNTFGAGGDQSPASVASTLNIKDSTDANIESLRFVRDTPASFKNNLKILWGYSADNPPHNVTEIKNNAGQVIGYEEIKNSVNAGNIGSNYYGEITTSIKSNARWNSRSDDNSNVHANQNNAQSVTTKGSYQSVFASWNQSTIESAGNEEFFITNVTTTLTETGMRYDISAISTDNFILNGFKFVQMYANLKGTAKELLALFMKTFNETHGNDSLLRVVWADETIKMPINGDEFIKDFDGRYIPNTEENRNNQINTLNSEYEKLQEFRDIYVNTMAVLARNDGNKLESKYFNHNPIDYNILFSEEVTNGIGNYYNLGKLNCFADTALFLNFSSNINANNFTLDTSKNSADDAINAQQETTVQGQKIKGAMIGSAIIAVAAAASGAGLLFVLATGVTGFLRWYFNAKKNNFNISSLNAEDGTYLAFLKICKQRWDVLNSNNQDVGADNNVLITRQNMMLSLLLAIKSNYVSVGASEIIDNLNKFAVDDLDMQLTALNNIERDIETLKSSTGLDVDYELPEVTNEGSIRNPKKVISILEHADDISQKAKSICEGWNKLFNDLQTKNDGKYFSLVNGMTTVNMDRNVKDGLHNTFFRYFIYQFTDNYGVAADKSTVFNQISYYCLKGNSNVSIQNEYMQNFLAGSDNGSFFATYNEVVRAINKLDNGALADIYSKKDVVWYEKHDSTNNNKFTTPKSCEDIIGYCKELEKFFAAVYYFLDELVKRGVLSGTANCEIYETIINSSSDATWFYDKSKKIAISKDGTVWEGTWSADPKEMTVSQNRNVSANDSFLKIINSIFEYTDGRNELVLLSPRYEIYGNPPIGEKEIWPHDVSRIDNFIGAAARAEHVSWFNGRDTFNERDIHEQKGECLGTHIMFLEQQIRDLKKNVENYKKDNNNVLDQINTYTLGRMENLVAKEIKKGNYSIDYGTWQNYERGLVGPKTRTNYQPVQFWNKIFDKVKQVGAFSGIGSYRDYVSEIYAEYEKIINNLEIDIAYYANEIAELKDSDDNLITINLGGEEAKNNYISGRENQNSSIYYKSISSLFSSYTSQCPPHKEIHAKGDSNETTEVNFTTVNELGEQIQAEVETQTSNRMMTWSVMGTDNYVTVGNKTFPIPIVGFRYAKPFKPARLRVYSWGNGNSELHCIKNLSIQNSSEFGMLNMATSLNLMNGTLNKTIGNKMGKDKDGNDERQLSQNIQAADLYAANGLFANAISYSDAEQDSIINKMVNGIKKGTIEVLGDPSLRFQGMFAPYCYPIYLDIKLEKESTAWGDANKAFIPCQLSGYYVITKITHNLSNSGYTTTLEVMSYPGIGKNLE